jgi:hypothetical protein
MSPNDSVLSTAGWVSGVSGLDMKSFRTSSQDNP